MANINEVSGTGSLFALADDGRATKLSTYKTRIYYKSAAEIVDYDSVSKRLFATSAATNSVSVSHGKIVVSVEHAE